MKIDGKTISFDAPTGYSMAPPGTYYSIVSRPTSRRDEAMEVAVVHEHRFAFFFWNRWRRAKSKVPRPDLITLDWHKDLGWPDDGQKRTLDDLDLDHETGMSIASWIELHPHNDDHILAAAYLDLIGDVYVLQKHDEDDGRDEFIDGKGQVHTVRWVTTMDVLLQELVQAEIENVYLDIDLDYFTESDDPDGGGDVRLVPEDQVRQTVDPDGPLMRFVMPRLRGFTIALEPEFCGGLRKAHRLFEWVDSTLFEPGIGHWAGLDGCQWKHLR